MGRSGATSLSPPGPAENESQSEAKRYRCHRTFAQRLLDRICKSVRHADDGHPAIAPDVGCHFPQIRAEAPAFALVPGQPQQSGGRRLQALRRASAPCNRGLSPPSNTSQQRLHLTTIAMPREGLGTDPIYWGQAMACSDPILSARKSMKARSRAARCSRPAKTAWISSIPRD
jgi:hypothetical protein